jgi:acetate---CoA ligase (ADP-forming)
MKSNPDISCLFEPRSVAVIGASHDKHKIGYNFLENIILSGYKGRLYPINPEGGEILGKKVYPKLEDVGDEVDLACVMIPAKYVFGAIQSCASKKVKFITIISSGFAEIGNSAEERKIAEYARDNGMRVLGPNIFGIFSAAASMNATFGPSTIKLGNVGVITQSGALGIGMIGKTITENIGLSAIVSVGNKSDIDETDLLEYLVNQDMTRIILMYIEGVSNGERLVNILKEATRKKPVVVIKAGRSRRGAMAAASHTGSLAGEDKVFDDVIKQCGVLRAENVTEALNWCKFLASSPLPRGENTVIITNGGGMGVMATDACEKYNVNLYDNVNNLKKTFEGVIPEFGSAKNPVDLTGQAPAVYYDNSLKAALENKAISSVVCIACETAVFDNQAFSQIVQKEYEDYKKAKPIVFSLFGGPLMEQSLLSFKKNEVPAFSDVYDAVSLLGAMYAYYRNLIYDNEKARDTDLNSEAINQIVRKVRQDRRTSLFGAEAQAIMNIAGIPTPKSRLARNLEEAVAMAEEIGYPIVLKIVSKDIVHKSEAGGVALDLSTREEVIDAYEAILHSARAYKPDAQIEGVEVDEMLQKQIETIVGARRDHAFGPIVMFGLGGIYVEVMKDIAFRSYPLGPKETMKMISQIRSYPLLLGVRGEKRKDIDAVADAIIKVGAILQKCKDISDIEINPLVAYDQGEGVRAVDVRILLSTPTQEAENE